MKLKLYLVLVFIGFADLGYAQSYKNELVVISENDAYIDITSDHYYTNGFFIKYRHAMDGQKLKSGLAKQIIGFEVGQKIYNAYYSFAPNPATHDRPFSAYLYGEANLSRYYANKQMIKVSAQVGVSGKDALGEKFQKAFHRLVGQNKIDGWEYALNSEPTLNLGIDYNRLLAATDNGIFDITGTASAAVGNVITKAGIGSTLRFGRFNGMDNSAAFNSLVSNNNANNAKRKYELFLSISPQLHLVAFDSSLQGGLFVKDKGPITFKPKPAVFTTQVGLAFAIARWTANYTATFTTNEVKDNAAGYRFAYYSLAYRFSKS
ncbi:lipid A deacylase LpxR family protein [Pedobacter frigidisoli]|uniref:Lipid A deacylase LpxR family protein n=1 Tax=Pedobacter frigidisoli TaxID=2530455 RepID=A0A4R0NTN1_9SPHI|nr:lipid A deacylase LpxR family protein [Pedobacter frigidisoli]TCD04667.1 lipid A deacylase LpxR family protein [Pedobacter frigidisoli]